MSKVLRVVLRVVESIKIDDDINVHIVSHVKGLCVCMHACMYSKFLFDAHTNISELFKIF